MAEGGAGRDSACSYMLCERHPDAKVEIYCEQHSVVCCLACAWKYHHECRPKPCMLEEARQKFQDEHIDLIDQLMTCSDSCNEDVDALEKQIELLEDAETSVRTNFTKIKAEIIVKLDDMEQQLADDIDDYICDKAKKLKDDLATLKEQQQNIDETKQTIQNLLQNNDSSMVAAFVKLKRIIKSREDESRTDVRIPTFNVSKEVHDFLNCSVVGSFRNRPDDYENVDTSAEMSKEDNTKVDEDDETLMSDVLPDDKEMKSRPKQERSGITFGKIFRLFKFRGNQQTPAKKSTVTTNPIPLPLAASGNIEDEEWYHGDITRDVANARLLGNGDYLLRAKPNYATGGSDYVLSVCSKIQHHAFIKSVKGGWKFKGRRFTTIEDLIKHLHHTMTPLISASHKVVLQSPVSSKSLDEVGGATAGSIQDLELLENLALCSHKRFDAPSCRCGCQMLDA